jgi:drug/metabolite transporter (DMT)-like permease
MNSSPNSQVRGYQVLLTFVCLYLFWGGTYTAARVGVELVPAPVLAGVRLGISGCLMLLFARLGRKRILARLPEMQRLFILGILLLFFGNVGLVWAEFYLPSGLCALLVAIVPVYVALIELLLPHGERLRIGGQIGLVMGFAGLGILAWPSARAGLHGDRHQVLAVAVLLLGALSFACGSIWSRHAKFALDLFVCAGWEMLAAGFCNLVLATGLREWGHAHWGRVSFSAIAYLIIFGSLIGFSAFSWLLHHVSVTKVTTYAYVNPMVAVLLGALMLGERLRRNEWIGMVIILAAVFLVTTSKVHLGAGITGAESAAIPSEIP